jgi:mRNA interferase MazF
LKRGDIVTIAAPGNNGKPRPALIIQADVFNDIHSSITVVPLTSTIIDAPLFRITLDPSRQNGLNRVSQIMVDGSVALTGDSVYSQPPGTPSDEMAMSYNSGVHETPNDQAN